MHAISNRLTEALISFLDYEDRAKLAAAAKYAKKQIMFILDGGRDDDAQLIRAASFLEGARGQLKNPGRTHESFISATKSIGRAVTIMRESNL